MALIKPELSLLTAPWRRTLLVTTVAQMCAMIGFSSVFPFLPLYVHELGSSLGMDEGILAGLVYSGQAFTMMLASPLWGSLADRYGRKMMVERSMFGGALLLVVMAFVRSAEQLVLLRMLQGLITGTAGAANALVAAVVPRERMGYAMGLLQVAAGAGLAVGPLIGGATADAFGYRAAFYVTGAMLFLGGTVVLFGVKEHFKPPLAPGKAGFGFLTECHSILASPNVSATYAMRFINQLSRMIIIPVLPLLIVNIAVNASKANTLTGLVVGAASAAATLAGLMLGKIGDRIGHRKILIACSIGAGLLFLPQSLVTAPWQLVVLHTLAGAAAGGIVPAISALLASCTRPGQEGAVYGLDNSVGSGARAVAPMLGVTIAALTGVRSVFAATGLVYFCAAAIALWILKPTRG
ncbi:MAG TPA: MFS transporter [Desulfobacteraceae bacterium]|nr:MFS transporter [Desulfobacteraceae bacterium]